MSPLQNSSLTQIVADLGPVHAVVSTVVNTNHRPAFLSRDQRVTWLWRQRPADAAAKKKLSARQHGKESSLRSPNSFATNPI